MKSSCPIHPDPYYSPRLFRLFWALRAGQPSYLNYISRRIIIYFKSNNSNYLVIQSFNIPVHILKLQTGIVTDFHKLNVDFYFSSWVNFVGSCKLLFARSFIRSQNFIEKLWILFVLPKHNVRKSRVNKHCTTLTWYRWCSCICSIRCAVDFGISLVVVHTTFSSTPAYTRKFILRECPV